MAKNFGQPWNKSVDIKLTPENSCLVEFETRAYTNNFTKYHTPKGIYKEQVRVRFVDLKFYLKNNIKIKLLD